MVSFIAKPFLLRILLPRPHPDHSRCTQCGSCMEGCPMQSIDLKPYPVADTKCIRCYHCLNACPQKALNVSWQYGNLGDSVAVQHAFLSPLRGSRARGKDILICW